MASPANHLLAALPADEFVRIAHELEPVELRRRESLWAVGAQMGHVYFPESGAVAMIVGMDGGSVLETGLIGREGLVGLEPFFGLVTASRRGMVLVPGLAQRMTAAAFAALCQQDSPFHEAVRRYAGARMAAIAQSAVCDATHSIRQRCVRLLPATACTRGPFRRTRPRLKRPHAAHHASDNAPHPPTIAAQDFAVCRSTDSGTV
jgi:signal-transduction protein with cAMP-binding, CBS, and nucleotidyltransferase domain